MSQITKRALEQSLKNLLLQKPITKITIYDVWVGSGDKKTDAIMCIVDLMKKDSEIKILVGCTEEEKLEVYKTHNETQYMKGVLIRR